MKLDINSESDVSASASSPTATATLRELDQRSADFTESVSMRASSGVPKYIDVATIQCLSVKICTVPTPPDDLNPSPEARSSASVVRDGWATPMAILEPSVAWTHVHATPPCATAVAASEPGAGASSTRPKFGLNSYIVSSDTRSTQLAVIGSPVATGAALADGEGEGDGGADADGDGDGDGDAAGDGDPEVPGDTGEDPEGDTDGDGDALDPANASDGGVRASSAEQPARPSASAPTPTPTTVNANRETTTPRFSDKPTTFLLQLFMSSSPTSTPGLIAGARSGRDRIIDRDPR